MSVIQSEKKSGGVTKRNCAMVCAPFRPPTRWSHHSPSRVPPPKSESRTKPFPAGVGWNLRMQAVYLLIHTGIRFSPCLLPEQQSAFSSFHAHAEHRADHLLSRHLRCGAERARLGLFLVGIELCICDLVDGVSSSIGSASPRSPLSLSVFLLASRASLAARSTNRFAHLNAAKASRPASLA